MSDYGINDIQHLSFKEGVRKRIQMYLGSADNEGIYQALKEIINNSTDEALCGYGKQIDISVDEDTNEIEVQDYGRGVPFGIRDDGENVLVAIYSQSHTGGKFGEGAYKNVSGLNGIGAKCVCLSSIDFVVESCRDGKCARAVFHKGDLVSYTESDTKHKNGTMVRFIPDPEVFKDEPIHYDFERICTDIKNISYLYSGITFNIHNMKTGKKISVCAKNGIKDFVKDNNPNPLHKNIIYEKVSDGTDELEIAFQWGDGKENSFVFVNGLCCPEGGSPITGAKTAITRTFNSLAKENFDGDAIRKGLTFVINCSVKEPSFANQTKSKINNANLRTLASNAFSNALKQMKLKYPADFENIAKVLKTAVKAEAAAERARQQVLNANKDVEKAQKKKMLSSDKLKDSEFLGQNSTLLIVEGNSALGTVAMARDYTQYGILAIRGKIINCLSNDEEKIFNNEEIKLLMTALNIQYGHYDAKKLRYGKVAICTDADSDGYHIALLIMAAFAYLAPDFIKEGRLCWLHAPLYIVKNGQKEEYYFTDEELSNAKGSVRGEITRNKGLGEMEADSMSKSMFDPKHQRMEVLEWDDDAMDLLADLMGEEVQPRTDFIMKNVDFSEVKE